MFCYGGYPVLIWISSEYTYFLTYLLKLVNYGKLQMTRPTERPSKANLHDINKNLVNIATEAKIALCGASIVNGLERYPDVRSKCFAPICTINLGIGGNKVEIIQWRMEDMFSTYCRLFISSLRDQ